MNPLVELQAFGQSFWYDNIRRKYLRDGTIRRLIDDDGLRGMTSNPAIFENAICSSDDYDEQLAQVVSQGADTFEIYEALALADIRAACDLFSPVYADTGGADGYVSLEVSPHLAHDTASTVEQARRLFTAVARPNVMIKVPATREGIPAIRQLIADGVNVNITLMFSMAHYEAVANAYIEGLTSLVESGRAPEKVASVASFFVSRVDSAVDKRLAALENEEADALMGKAAIANSKVVYQRYRQIFHGEMFSRLAAAGAARQRLLWASTSTKNPEYPDTLYVDELIGPETVNTMPPSTIDAFRDHGRPDNTLEQKVDEARSTLLRLDQLGIDLNDVAEVLQRDGVTAFADAFDKLLNTVDERSVEFAAS